MLRSSRARLAYHMPCDQSICVRCLLRANITPCHHEPAFLGRCAYAIRAYLPVPIQVGTGFVAFLSIAFARFALTQPIRSFAGEWGWFENICLSLEWGPPPQTLPVPLGIRSSGKHGGGLRATALSNNPIGFRTPVFTKALCIHKVGFELWFCHIVLSVSFIHQSQHPRT
jgi:hypothetical protein